MTWGSNLRLYRVLDQNEAAGSKTSEKELIGINRQEILFVCVGDKKFKFSQSFLISAPIDRVELNQLYIHMQKIILKIFHVKAITNKPVYVTNSTEHIDQNKKVFETL